MHRIPPIGLIREAGATGVALDLDLVTDLDVLGEALDAGLGLFAGAVPTGPLPAGPVPAGADGPDAGTSAEELSQRAATKIRQLWRNIGFSVNDLAAQVVVTPACGLAGATPDLARTVMAACRQAGHRLLDD